MRASLLLLLFAPQFASAAYLFEVPRVDMTVRVQPDASVRVDYEMEFSNAPSAQAIDIVDVGMPTDDYALETMGGALDGVLVSDVRHSQYVTPGVEAHLPGRGIAPGTNGTFTFHYQHPDLVFADTTDDALASLRITPTWFGGEYVQGTTDLKVAIILPPGVSAEEVLHQGLEEFASKADTGEGATVLFHWPAERFTSPHLVGISFPLASMERVVRVTRWELLVKAVEDDSDLRVIIGLIGLALLALLFFRFSGGTGIVVFLLLLGGFWLASTTSVPFQILWVPGGLVLVAVNEAMLRRRKGRYMPPIAQIEGGGIKRGLTAPEAAVLLEQPLGKVLTLVIFGLLKKGVLEVLDPDPLAVQVAEPFRIERTKEERVGKERRIASRRAGVALRSYEEGFLRIIEKAGRGRPLAALEFSDALKELIEGTAERLGGFDLSDTQDYYKQIIERALREAESEVSLPEKQEETLDRNLEWILLRDGAGGVLDGYHYRPPWHRNRSYESGGRRGGVGSVTLPGGGAEKGASWSPTLGDATAGYAGWAEKTFGDLANAILPGEVGPKGSGVLDLSGVDKVTGDVLAAMAENSGGGGSSSGGGGGSCACACAGCACACACAGGGR